MKVTKLTTFVVPPRWLFLKVETDEGVTGWGEPVVEGRAETAAAEIDAADCVHIHRSIGERLRYSNCLNDIHVKSL